LIKQRGLGLFRIRSAAAEQALHKDALDQRHTRETLARIGSFRSQAASKSSLTFRPPDVIHPACSSLLQERAWRSVLRSVLRRRLTRLSNCASDVRRRRISAPGTADRQTRRAAPQ
jgi:hypothetical protein